MLVIVYSISMSGSKLVTVSSRPKGPMPTLRTEPKPLGSAWPLFLMRFTGAPSSFPKLWWSANRANTLLRGTLKVSSISNVCVAISCALYCVFVPKTSGFVTPTKVVDGGKAVTGLLCRANSLLVPWCMPVVSGRLPHYFLEQSGEIISVVIAQAMAYFGKTQVCGVQHLAGAFYLEVQKVLNGRGSGLLFVARGEVRGR